MEKDVLCFTLAPSFGFQLEPVQWEGEGFYAEKISMMNVGVGLEYGPADWISLQVLWLPGPVAWYDLDGGGRYGQLPDLYTGLKLNITGPNSFSGVGDWFRFSLATGAKLPLMSLNSSEVAGTEREPDRLLWGSVLRLYGDFIIHNYFSINLFAEGIFYPAQRTANPLFSGTAEHWLDITGELEFHFEMPIKDSGVYIKAAAAPRFWYAPFMNQADPYAPANQWGFTIGGYAGVLISKMVMPVEILAGYNAPIVGLNVEPVHRVSLAVKLHIPVSKWRIARQEELIAGDEAWEDVEEPQEEQTEEPVEYEDTGYYDEEGNYIYADGSYYDPDGVFHYNENTFD